MAATAHRSAVLIGQCIAHNTRNAAKVRVKRLIFDNNLNMYFPKHKNYYAHDPDGECKTGDIVVIRELPEKMSRVVTHSLIKMVYKFGDVTDPITGKKVVVGQYREHVDERDEMFGVAEDGSGGFKYSEAPDRGWQQGKRDFTHKVGYQKWHEFEPGHRFHNDPVAS
ncbi:28S ribosomal protein S17, mitochondrial-like isoform X1 [Portunus trituberculatus]|uniref:28S ribosomal protein S17, mitochondrial-like isoform X1 n=1 Tax=Portunus trituberculatus TaxID=210409 RepID=UPI001E1CE90E|nr:28S ribosomal protein S17, mitochondrial-like isoform X1 [Portunus trituberculatus]